MNRSPLLARRAVLAAGATLAGWPLAASSGARAQDSRQRITLGQASFAVPKAYLFGELAPNTTADGLPPRFSFAFLAPGGAAAGAGLQFPPVSHPYVAEHEGGQFLVMCYRVSASGPGALHTAPRDQLANTLVDTDLFTYSKEDGALVVRPSPADPREQRYVALVDDRDKSGIEAWLEHGQGTQFFFGTAAFEKPAVSTVVYIPQEHRTAISAVLAQASELLLSWKVG